jgi:hypothetical protein
MGDRLEGRFRQVIYVLPLVLPLAIDPQYLSMHNPKKRLTFITMSIPLLQVGRLQMRRQGIHTSSSHWGWSEWVIGGSNRVTGNCLSAGDPEGSSRDKETYSGPVSIPVLQALLVSIEGIGLNVDKGACWQLQLGYFPGDNVFNITSGLETTECDHVAMVDCPSFPDLRNSGDPELDACLDFFLLNILDTGVKDLKAFPRVPALLRQITNSTINVKL